MAFMPMPAGMEAEKEKARCSPTLNGRTATGLILLSRKTSLGPNP